MTVSLRRVSVGAGYHYLLRSVVAGDGDRALATPLTRYYAEAGTPPGRWMGAGLAALGNGRITSGRTVTEEQLALLIGMGRDPVSGIRLGRAYPEHRSLRERIAKRVAGLDQDMSHEERAAATATIEAEETVAGSRRAVAGYDLTFSVPKSVSVLWGLSDAATQQRIVDAHHAAMADVLAFFEREVAATRAGIADQDGAVAQIEVVGVTAAAYDHYDSRAGDPQLHTHLIVSNKVLTVRDSRWRSLDGRPVHASVTGLSTLYDALLADRLTRELGVEWELRQRGADRNPRWEIAGVGDVLIREFSGRSREIDLEKDRLIAAYVERHGRRPSEKKIVELRAQATLATRPPKRIRSLADLTAEWRRRAVRRLGVPLEQWAAARPQSSCTPLTVEDVPPPAIDALAAEVVSQVQVKRATWTHWNLMAEASRQTMDLRFAAMVDREVFVGRVVDAAQRRSVSLTPPEPAISPAEFQRPDGTSVFRPRHAVRYSSTVVLDAEARLLDRAALSTAPVVPAGTCERVLRSTRTTLSAEQANAVRSIATSGRSVDLLVGPAGSGKTTTMRALRDAWTARAWPGDVVGLAPSAAAAQALSEDLGVVCDNTAKWLHEFDRGNAALRSGQLVIIDEASLADTATVDRITEIAVGAGAKVLLVGDPYQLQAVDAGGAFALLVDRRSDVPELNELHRFAHDWEKSATLALRRGEIEVISTYERHRRISGGSTEDMLHAAYAAWRSDIDAGLASILVTESTHAVHMLNERARAERLVRDGAVDGREIDLVDGARASAGDVVITRRNDRALTTGPGAWVKNGDRWLITDVHGGGSLSVRRLGTKDWGSVVLPAGYVREHVDLGYAVTAHRAQGVTVDSAHVVVTASTAHQNLYVSMTRGRASNNAYVALDQLDDSHTVPETDEVTARSILVGVLNHASDGLSATQTIEREHAEHMSIARLAAEYETIAAEAQRERFVELLGRSGLTAEQLSAAVASPAFGPLSAALRRAEAEQGELSRLLHRVVRQHPLADVDDVAAVLRYRIDAASPRWPRSRPARSRLIAGLIPEALGPLGDEARDALAQRKELIEARARALGDVAVGIRPRWVAALGEMPTDPAHRGAWISAVGVVAAYRDRYGITADLPLGAGARSDAERRDRSFARSAVRTAALVAAHDRRATPRVSVPAMSR